MAHHRRSSTPLLLSVAVLLVLAGCSKNEPATTTTTASQPAAAPAAAPAATPAAGPAAAPTTPAIQSQDANQAGIVAELTECKRGDGVLTVKVRFRNTSGQPIPLSVIDARDYEKFYVTAGSKKYFILKDSEGAYLTPNANAFGSLGVDLKPGQGWLWWAKFPAPPADATKITLITPITPPFEDVPITDK
ncbi:MAG TPA: hypothetical protein VEG08_14635 [Terriglobales bacterium]|nr:hypothetical protein [Terriglobales bacterium]